MLSALERAAAHEPNGKLDRRALPAPSAAAALEGRPPQVAPRDAGGAADGTAVGGGPRGSADRRPRRFFDLGGHSLKAFRLMGAVQREFGVELPLNLVFRRRTVELLCEALPEAGAAAARLLVPLAEGDPARPPLILVHPRGGDVVCYRDLVRGLAGSPLATGGSWVWSPSATTPPTHRWNGWRRWPSATSPPSGRRCRTAPT
ncbi:phosphopantetheine-binding protein [Streptomyces cirratus]